jgi:ABC-2 type transport system permease protein
MFLLSFFGGLFTPVQSMPTALRDVAQFLPTYHVASLGWAVAAGRAPGLGDAGTLIAYTLVLAVAVTWRHRALESAAFA